MPRTGLKSNQSRLPSSVYNLKAAPLVSRTVSAEPFSPATVENRTKSRVVCPTPRRNLASVYLEMSLVTLNSPKAPAPFAWTYLSTSACPYLQAYNSRMCRDVPLRNPLPGDMGDGIDGVEILDQLRHITVLATVFADVIGCLGVFDRTAC